ncbi:hypothetical protein PHMEG_00034995 [Phytophthora megakarya]|uniref:Kazal-like domain-containing protein n=1 Tax=Phytophthora megakarya TaxID=4795 RepID=A0A225UPS3_9STRA|nr:hypothetical protein PHMEG_00034995 [Phytophthora megakarya]
MKFVTEVVCAAIAIASTAAESNNTLDPNALKFPASDMGPGPVVVPGSPEESSRISDLGPAVDPNIPGFEHQIAHFDKVWKDYLKREGVPSSTSGSSDSNCAQVCPDVNDPVCGSDGVTYHNSCKLGVASCKNPMKKIAKKAEGRCSS